MIGDLLNMLNSLMDAKVLLASQEEVAARASMTLGQLVGLIKSDMYPCPICLEQGREEPGQLKLRWEVEHDEYYPVSSWPYLEGTCEDPKLEPDAAVLVRRDRYRLNHADSINCNLEDDMEDRHMARVLGQSAERRRLREVLGVR